MNQLQKKIIIRTLIILCFFIFIGLSATWLSFTIKDFVDSKGINISDFVKGIVAWFFSNFGTMIIGIIIKTYINKKNIKAIDNVLIESGVKPLKDIKQSNRIAKNELKDYFHYNGFHFKKSKTRIEITYPPKDKANEYKDLKQALGEFIEQVRNWY